MRARKFEVRQASAKKQYEKPVCRKKIYAAPELKKIGEFNKNVALTSGSCAYVYGVGCGC